MAFANSKSVVGHGSGNPNIAFASSNLGSDQQEIFTEPLSVPSITTYAKTTIPKRKRDEVILYTIQGGDTISDIASRFEIPQSAIIWSNGLSGSNPIIKSGDSLKIVQGEGLIHKIESGETVESIAKKYGSDPERIMPENPKVIFATGSEIFIPGGKPPAPKPTPIVTPTQNTYQAPNDTQAQVPVNTSNGNLYWPTSGRITQYYGKTPFSYNYSSGIHTGIDIASSSGTTIYATESGTILSAKWDGGYGLSVRINHGDGLVSIYGHMSKIAVGYGEWVEKGDVIGYMGSTGWSTGPHLHFEIRKNGTIVNPLDFTYDK